MAASTWRTCAAFLGATAVVAAVAWARHRKQSTSKSPALGDGVPATPAWRVATIRTAVQAAAIVAVAVGSSVIYHRFAARGLLADASVAEEVEFWNTAAFLPRRTFADVSRAVEQKDVLIVDARDPTSFNDGHIPGAVNVSAVGLFYRGGTLMAGSPAGLEAREIIVYCSDEHCGAAADIAQRLKYEGAAHVTLYDAGYGEWLRKAGKHQASRTSGLR